MAKFQLGTIVATPGAMDAASPEVLSELLRRHASGDWGELDDEDWQTNETALREGARLFSEYTVNGTKFWIITEWDRNVTTTLLPSEY